MNSTKNGKTKTKRSRIKAPELTASMRKTLKEIRLEKKLTQAELGKKIKMNPGQISSIECGKLPMTDESMQKILDGFGITLTQFLNIHANKNRNPVDYRLRKLTRYIQQANLNYSQKYAILSFLETFVNTSLDSKGDSKDKSVNPNETNKSIRHFIKECCIYDNGKRTSNADIYDRYLDFCIVKDYSFMSKISFCKKFKSIINEIYPSITDFKTKDTRGYTNLKLLSVE